MKLTASSRVVLEGVVTILFFPFPVAFLVRLDTLRLLSFRGPSGACD